MVGEGVDRRGVEASEMGARPHVLWVQVVAMLLAAFVPVAWLVGRRAIPPAAPSPLLLASDDTAIDLPASPRGLAAGVAPKRLSPPTVPNGAYHLHVKLSGPDDQGRPPYRVVLEGPEGGDLWQGTWGGTASAAGQGFDLILPAAGLRSGRYALRVEDAAQVRRIYPFIVP
jgi:hypothetical protein